MKSIRKEHEVLRVSGKTGEELEALQKKWEELVPEVDGSPMPVLGRLGLFAAYRDQAYVHVLAPFDLTLIDAHTLQVLRLLGPGASACPSDLVRFPFHSRAGMTRALDRLEGKGLVVRRADKEDRRRVYVSLTGEGEETSDRFREAELAYMNRALEGVSDRERRALSRILDKMIDNLDGFGEDDGE